MKELFNLIKEEKQEQFGREESAIKVLFNIRILATIIMVAILAIGVLLYIYEENRQNIFDTCQKVLLVYLIVLFIIDLISDFVIKYLLWEDINNYYSYILVFIPMSYSFIYYSYLPIHYIKICINILDEKNKYVRKSVQDKIKQIEDIKNKFNKLNSDISEESEKMKRFNNAIKEAMRNI